MAKTSEVSDSSSSETKAGSVDTSDSAKAERAEAWQTYPFSLPSFQPVFDDGLLCERELKEESTSWRSDIYAENSSLFVADYCNGVGKTRYCNDSQIEQLLKDEKQPKLRLVETNCVEKLGHRLAASKSAGKNLYSNELYVDSEEIQEEETKPADNTMNISRSSLLKIMTKYNIPPQAASHIRGQEQSFGKRMLRSNNGKPLMLDFWYAIRARAYIRAANHDADLKMTLVTHYDCETKSTIVLIKHRSFNDLTNPVKIELRKKLETFIHDPALEGIAEDPFAVHLLYFGITIQYFRRAARDPRDAVRQEEEKAHDNKELQGIDIKKLHLTIGSLTQDVVQVNFMLDVLDSLRKVHDGFYRIIKKQNDSDMRDEAFYRIQDEFDRFSIQLRYFKTLVHDVSKKAQRLLDMLFNLHAKANSEWNKRIASQAVQESVSMSTIAILTMFFLPGTFVTGILGSNIFSASTDAGGKVVLRAVTKWWVFLAATIPLTLLTFGLWYAWRRMSRKWLRKSGMIDAEQAYLV